MLSETADEALASGVRLLLENHSDFSVDEYEQVMDEVGRARVGVFLDLTNSVASLEDPIVVVERLAPYAYAAHVKDYVFESMQQPDGYHRRGFAVHYRYPGEGVAPLDRLVPALAALRERPRPLPHGRGARQPCRRRRSARAARTEPRAAAHADPRLMPGRVEGKVALVTGAAAGQGAAHARLLAQEGASVLCLDVTLDEGDAVAAGIAAAGGDALFQPLDVGEPAGWEAAVAVALGRWGRIDVLVNNAGIIRLDGFLDETIEGWNDVIRVDQFGVFLGMKHVLPTMLAQRSGSIINISSNMGIAAIPEYAAYHAAKGAVVLMSRNAAVTYGPMGIRVNTICPGLVWTAMSEGDESCQPIIDATPLRRGAQPEEISPGVLFLASDESRFVTGSELIMDGGYLAQ